MLRAEDIELLLSSPQPVAALAVHVRITTDLDYQVDSLVWGDDE